MTDDLKEYSAYAKEWAQRQREGNNIHHQYLEKPAMRALLPDVSGKSVLCVGCGTGEECRTLKDLGAARVVGIDNAEGMIHIAQQSWPDIQWQTMAMEHIDFPADSFDFVYSSLTLHYAESWIDILQRIKACMKPGATMLLSIPHPLWESLGLTDTKFRYELSCSFDGDDKYTINGDYLTVRKTDRTFFDELKVSFWHRPLSALINDIIAAGLTIDGMWEPTPIPEAKAKKKNFWAVHHKIPWLAIFRLRA